MDIEQMHIWIRQYAQQMGLQNIRGLLPEQIDLLINTSVTDILNQVINSNLGLTNDRIATDNSKIGQINALSTLYQVCTTNFDAGEDGVLEEATGKVYTIEEAKNLGYITSTKVYGDYGYKQGYTYSKITYWSIADSMDAERTCELSRLSKSNQKVLYAVDASVNYKLTGNKTSSIYPVRIIEDSYLSDALQDYILAPKKRAPLAVVNDGKIVIYFGKDHSNITPYQIRFSYVKKPNIVKYDADLNGENVDCDMPEYMHVDICKHAVELYQQSISGQIQSAQTRERQQRQEMVRNQAQPTPYGAQDNSQQQQ